MTASTPGADLHLHLYGCIRSDDLLAYLSEREVDWDPFEAGFREAFGRPAGVEAILARHRAGDPAARDDFQAIYVVGEDDAGSFRRFQAKFDLLVHGSEFARLRGGTGSLAGLAAEIDGFVDSILRDQLSLGVRHAELRMLLSSELPGELATAAMRRMCARFGRASSEGLEARLALSLPRADPWPHWERVAACALEPGGEAITAVDFCSFEEGHPPKEKAELFAAVRDHNQRHPSRALAVLYHVGESYEDKSLESAIRWVQEAAEMGATRLGHAIALGIDPAVHGEVARSESVAERADQLRYDLAHADGLAHHGVKVDRGAVEAELRALQRRPDDDILSIPYDRARLDALRRRQRYAASRVRATGAVVEVCPTSNQRIAGLRDAEHHPVHAFVAEDLPWVVASDDPGIFDTTLDGEIQWVVDACDLGAGAADEIRRAAWRYRSEVMTGRCRDTGPPTD